MGFFTPENVNATGLSNCILTELNKILQNDPDKLIGQTYDGANVMKGERGGVQHKIKEIYHNAHFIHCYAHQLNLIMKHVTFSIKSVRLFLQTSPEYQHFFQNYLKNYLYWKNMYLLESQDLLIHVGILIYEQ